MNRIASVLDRELETGLQSVVEPLASYICATEHPRDALLSAVKVLLREVEQTNRAAVVHCAFLAEAC